MENEIEIMIQKERLRIMTELNERTTEEHFGNPIKWSRLIKEVVLNIK